MRNFRLAAYSLVVVLIAWALEQILATLFLCQPISYNWDGSIDGHCGSVAVNCIAGAAINTLYVILWLDRRIEPIAPCFPQACPLMC